MQILEVKNDIAKITYNPAENRLLPSDFLLIEDANQKLIAQIINIETTDKSDENLAILRLALSIDLDDNLSYFNGYIPSKTSKLIYITPDEIIELVKGNDKNIYLGNLSNHPSCYVKTSMSYIDDRLYIQSDRNDKTQIVVQNLVSELRNKNKKVIIIDFNGQYTSAADELKLTISENIKLPLNIEAFDTILQYDTTDCPIEDKAVIQSIVLELREYMKTLKDKFIPFDMFKNVVDAEFESNPVSGLMLLRNKLWLYAQDGIFANNKEEFDVINSMFFNQNIIIVDASNIEEKWFKFVIQTVSGLTNHNCYLFLSLNDIQIDKKSIIGLYNKENILPVVTTSYDSPYRPILKSLCKNHLLCKPSNYLNEEAHYAPILNRMNNGDFILYGETTLNLPLLLELQPFDSDTAENVAQNEIKKDVDKFLSSPNTVIPKNTGVINDAELDSELPEIDALDSVEEIDEFDALGDIQEAEIVSEPVDVSLQENSIEDDEEEKLLDFPQETVVDDEFNDSDLDFLDEVSEQNTTTDDDDILNVPFELSYENQSGSASMLAGTSYGVFNPVAEDLNENSTFVEKITAESLEIVEDVEQLSVDENIDDILDDIPNVSETVKKEENKIQELPDDILLEDIDEVEENDVVLIEDDIQNLSDDVELIPDEVQPSNDIELEDTVIEKTSVQQEILDDSDDAIADISDAEASLDAELASIDDVIEGITNKEEVSSQEEHDILDDIQSEDEPQETKPEEENNDTSSLEELDDILAQEEEEVISHVPETKELQAAPPPVKENIQSRENQDVQVYETDIPNDASIEDVPFKVGDKVYHPKHGNGVIEAFSSYSNRILFCHILFDNVGRKIMDPRVSCIQKVS